MQLGELISQWAKNENRWLKDVAVFVVEISIQNAFPNSYALQDFARDVLRSSVHGTEPHDRTVYGGLPVTEIYDRLAEEMRNTYKLWEVFIEFADTIPQNGLTPEQVEVINSRAKALDR